MKYRHCLECDDASSLWIFPFPRFRGDGWLAAELAKPQYAESWGIAALCPSHPHSKVLLNKFSLTDFVGSWKIGWDWLSDFTRRGPLAAALEGRDEPDTLLGIVPMSHRRMKDPTFSKLHGEDHRLVPSRASFGLVGERRRE